MEEEEEQERVSRDKFKREREESVKDSNTNPKRERNSSPSELRGRKKEKFDDSSKNVRELEGNRERSRERSRERERGYDSYRSGRGVYRRNQSPDKGRGRSPPPFKRRRDDDWNFDRGGPRKRGGRTWVSGEPENKNTTRNIFEGAIRTYKQFLEIQDDTITPEQAEKKYEEYKIEYAKRQSKMFFDEHKNAEWFKERFNPQYLEEKRKERMEMSKKSRDLYFADLEAKKDFNLSIENHPEFQNNQSKVDSNEEEGEGEGDEIDSTHESLEINQSETKREEEEEEEQQPQDSNKTSSSTKSIKSKQSDRLEQPLESQEPRTTLFIKNIPPTAIKKELISIFGTTEGFQGLALSEPYRFKNYHRIGWATYDTPEHCLKALSELNGRRLKDFDLMLAVNKSSNKQYKRTPPIATEENRIEHDIEMTKKLCLLMDQEKSFDTNPILNEQSELVKDLTPLQLLDIRIAYLRRVHLFCYYCGDQFEDEGEMNRKCTLHLRGQKSQDKIINEQKQEEGHSSTDAWTNLVDQKYKIRLENPHDPNVYTGHTAVERAIEEFCNKRMAKIADDKYRCSICSKLFAGDHFVKKHQHLKHITEIEATKQQALEQQYFENFYNDPNRSKLESDSGKSGRIERRDSRGSDRRFNNHGDRYGDRYSPMNRDYSSSSRGGGGNRNYVRNRGYNRKDYGKPQDRPSYPPRPPPPGEEDPRSGRMIEYNDLDAPEEPVVNIDYGMVPSGQEGKQES